MFSVFDTRHFSGDYFRCRENFRSASKRQSAELRVYEHPIAGPCGAVLTTDTALLGPRDAENLIVIVSGTHGLESFAGSGIQISLLNEFDWNSIENTCVLFAHILNPWGAVNLRRQNEDNVDVNRNFRESVDEPASNPQYDQLHPILHRQELYVGDQRNPKIEKKIAEFRQSCGEAAFRSALFSGQTRHKDGIGFCGDRPSWSNRTIQAICEQAGANKKRVAVIDLHTGLGDYGVGSILYSQSSSGPHLKMAQRWFGFDLVAVHADESFPYLPEGDLISAMPRYFDKDADVVSVALEFGTFDVEILLQGQIEDNWLENFGKARSTVGRSIKRELKKFFFPSDGEWYQKTIVRTYDVLLRVLSEIDN